jgi:phosphoribosylaminoimidazole carboxylase PurE protein
MGSDSDWKTMQACVELLRQFEIEADVQVLSAHRSPDALHEYVGSAPSKGISVFICAAGLSAALAGVTAAHTTLPVIGVPMKGGALDGLDALLSTVQMPPGVPVASMGLGSSGAKNAAIMAASILALGDESLSQRLSAFKKDQAAQVEKKNQALRSSLSS